VVQGTVDLAPFQLAVLNFAVTSAGTLATRIDWSDVNNDLDTAILSRRCTVQEVMAEASGCSDKSVLVKDDGSAKPSVLSASVQPGEHTLIILNYGPGADTSTYRVEGFVSNEAAPARSASRKTETFAFTLPAGSHDSVTIGPVQAGIGPLEVTLDYSGSYRILACVGTTTACNVFGGRPTTAVYDISGDFPPGPIQARVYFNSNYTQPTGSASGTVTMTYNPL
jgi:hypothetical protein